MCSVLRSTHSVRWFAANMRGLFVVIAVTALVAAELTSSFPIKSCGCKKSKQPKSTDLCSCNCLTAIQSAPPLPPPPPYCPQCNCNCGCDELGELAGCGHVSFHKPSKSACADVFVELPPPPPPACYNPSPADQVSLALALQQSQRAQKKVLEEGLSFGPMQKPLNGALCKPKKRVPEAGLHALRKEVVELLPCSRFNGLTPEEEAEASMLAALQLQADELDLACDCCGPPLPTYFDIGYAPVTPGCNSAFVSGAPSFPCKKLGYF